MDRIKQALSVLLIWFIVILAQVIILIKTGSSIPVFIVMIVFTLIIGVILYTQDRMLKNIHKSNTEIDFAIDRLDKLIKERKEELNNE